MKMLLVGLLLIGCGIDDEEDTDKAVAENTNKTSGGGDLASKHQGRTIFSFGDCKVVPLSVDQNHSVCNYHRIAENSACGDAGNQCQVTIMPLGIATENEGESEKLKKEFWPWINWTAGCTCSAKEITHQGQEENSPTYQCESGKCSLEELQKGVLSKATRNYQPTSDDNKFSELEVDMINDLAKHVFNIFSPKEAEKATEAEENRKKFLAAEALTSS